MDVKVELPQLMQDCPCWWKNFVRETFNRSQNQSFATRASCKEYLNNNLISYSAKLLPVPDEEWSTTIVFNSEEDLLMFKLKWL